MVVFVLVFGSGRSGLGHAASNVQMAHGVTLAHSIPGAEGANSRAGGKVVADSGEMTGPTMRSLRWSERWSPPLVLAVAFVVAAALRRAVARPVGQLRSAGSEERAAGAAAHPVDVLERLQAQLSLRSDSDMLQTIVETIVSAVAADGVSLIVHGGETEGLSTTVGRLTATPPSRRSCTAASNSEKCGSVGLENTLTTEQPTTSSSNSSSMRLRRSCTRCAATPS